MIPVDVLNEASRRCLAAGIRILQGFRLGDTDERHVARLMEFMQPDPGSTWVDIGCGFGEVARLMSHANLNFILVNNNYFQLSHAPSQFLRLYGDMHDLPLEDETADGCMLLYTLCHANPPLTVLEEAARVTRPGGRLLVFDYERLPAPDNDVPDDDLSELLSPESDPHYLMQMRLFARAWPFDDLVRCADAAGWTVDLHHNPPGDDRLFRTLYGNDREYDEIFDALRPVIWTAIRR